MSELFIRKIFLSLGRICRLLALVSSPRPVEVCLCSHTVKFGQAPWKSPQDVLDLSSALPHPNDSCFCNFYNIYFFHFSSVTLELCLGTIYPQGENKPVTRHTSSGAHSPALWHFTAETECFIYFVQFHSLQWRASPIPMVGSINLDRFACKSCLRC